MSVKAAQIRSRRRQFAAPGGSHDRLVALLAKVLPAGIGLVVAVMILVPLSPRGEISFLLDRNKVAITSERLRADNAAYRGKDDRNRDFVINAGTAVQKTATTPIVELLGLNALMNLNDGPAKIVAPKGAYNYDTEKLAIDGPVNFNAPDGYSMTTRDVSVDLRSKTAVGSGGVNGTLSTGTFQANEMQADLENRTVVLKGNARMRMTPGKIRTPQ